MNIKFQCIFRNYNAFKKFKNKALKHNKYPMKFNCAFKII